MGDFEGGALELADGRRFTKKYTWYRYNGAITAHGVAPFTGERLSIVLYTEPPKTALYSLSGSNPQPLNQEAVDRTGEHPAVQVAEDPLVTAEREQQIAVVKEKQFWSGGKQLRTRHGMRFKRL